MELFSAMYITVYLHRRYAVYYSTNGKVRDSLTFRNESSYNYSCAGIAQMAEQLIRNQ